MSEHGLVLITCGDSHQARTIARHLVETRLAAGVQIVPIDSIYRWDGEIVDDHEWLLIAKTRKAKFQSIREAVDRLHSYEVPPVAMLEIDEASRPYLDWIDQNVAPEP